MSHLAGRFGEVLFVEVEADFGNGEGGGEVGNVVPICCLRVRFPIPTLRAVAGHACLIL